MALNESNDSDISISISDNISNIIPSSSNLSSDNNATNDPQQQQSSMSPVAVQHPQPPSNPTSRDAQVAKRYRSAPAKTFQCTGYGDCRMVFSRSEHLARHVRKHTGERPFTCHCSKQFSRLDNLRQHAQTVHSDKQEQNDAMMRDLTALHTSMAAAHKASSARSKRAQSSHQQQPPHNVGLGINMNMNTSKVEDALFQRNFSAANLHNLNYNYVGSSNTFSDNNNNSSSSSSSNNNNMRRLSVSTNSISPTSSRTSPSYSPPISSSTSTSSYLPLPRAQMPPTPPITPPTSIPFVTGTPFDPQQQQQQQYPLQQQQAQHHHHHQQQQETNSSPFLPPSPFSPPPLSSLPVGRHPHTAGHPHHHLQQQQQQQQTMYGQGQHPQPHSRRSLPLSPQPSPEGFPYHPRAEMGPPPSQAAASGHDRALHHVQVPLQRRISPPGILSPPDLDLSAAVVGWGLSPNTTSTSYPPYGTATTTTSPNLSQHVPDNGRGNNNNSSSSSNEEDLGAMAEITTGTHRVRPMVRAGSTIARFPSTRPRSPGTPLSASAPGGLNGLGYGGAANGGLTTTTMTTTAGSSGTAVAGNPTMTTSTERMMDVGVNMDGYPTSMDLVGPAGMGMDMGMMGIDGMGVNMMEGMVDMDMGLVVGDMDMRAAAALVGDGGRVLGGHRLHRQLPTGVVKKEKVEEDVLEEEQRRRMALLQQQQQQHHPQEVDPRQELGRGRRVDDCLSWNCATMTETDRQEGALYPYQSRTEPIVDLRRREEGLRARGDSNSHIINDKYHLQQQHQHQHPHQTQPHLGPHQRDGLRTVSADHHHQQQQVASDADFLNTMMNGLNGMNDLGAEVGWGMMNVNNGNNNGYPPHPHQAQRGSREVYGVGSERGSPEGMRR